MPYRSRCHILKNKRHNDRVKVLFRCDGDSQVGMGHVVRCLALAEALKKKQHYEVCFALGNDGSGATRVQEAGFPTSILPSHQSEEYWLNRLIADYRPCTLVLDVRSQLAVASVNLWKEHGVFIVTIDDPSLRRMSADLAFYPPVPQVHQLSWAGYSGRLLVGWEWILLKEDYFLPRPLPVNPVPRLLVTMGGSDPSQLTFLALQALDKIAEDFMVSIVLGPAFSHEEELALALKSARRRYEIVRNLPDLIEVATSADFAVAAFGVTAYELAALGVPAILLGLSADHAQSASCLADAGLAVNLGEASMLTPESLAEIVSECLKRSSWREEVTVRSRKLFHGGVENVVREIVTMLEQRVS